MHRSKLESGRKKQLFKDKTDEENAKEYENPSNESSEEGALVFLRLRPVKEESAFTARGNVLVVGPSSESTSSNNKNTIEKQFAFTNIFHRDIPQANVYENCVRSKIEAEESFSILTYGTSGSGKTFTLLGTDSNPGLVPRAIEQIFKFYEGIIYRYPSIKLVNGRIQLLEDCKLYPELELRKTLLKDCTSNTTTENIHSIICNEHKFVGAVDDDNSVFVWISFIEIYNENVYDLLEQSKTSAQTIMTPTPRRNLKITGSDNNVFVKNLTTVFVLNSVEALHLLNYGLQRVNYAATPVNANSSRSHCIFTIDVLKFDPTCSYTHICYRFCDLAGSERLQKTGNIGSRLKETQRINTSLMVLGRCLDAANNLQRKKINDLIPYRESKLTMFLQAALLGKEKLSMIVNILPSDKYYEENINVLGFASIAQNITFKQPVNKTKKMRCSFLSTFTHERSNQNANLRAQIEQLLEENISLRSEIGRLSDMLDNSNEQKRRELNQLEQNIRDQLTEVHEDIMKRQKKIMEETFKREMSTKDLLHAQELKTLKHSYEWEIEELNDELLNQAQKIEELQNKLRIIKRNADKADQELVEITKLDSIITVHDSDSTLDITDDQKAQKSDACSLYEEKENIEIINVKEESIESPINSEQKKRCPSKSATSKDNVEQIKRPLCEINEANTDF